MRRCVFSLRGLNKFKELPHYVPISLKNLDASDLFRQKSVIPFYLTNPFGETCTLTSHRFSKSTAARHSSSVAFRITFMLFCVVEKPFEEVRGRLRRALRLGLIFCIEPFQGSISVSDCHFPGVLLRAKLFERLRRKHITRKVPDHFSIFFNNRSA